jgi:RHH-type proline utilization regulon transcriptional repressor/proline dehydrogenase/delta 1-pyrroline-5-carboxylate dehydrogenase
VLELAQLARSYGIGFTIDAEEADRLELSLDVIAAAYADKSLDDWEGYGLAIQAYQKRAPEVIDFIADLARRHGRRIPVRLVKGAYWGQRGQARAGRRPGRLSVFTRKPNTDVSYLANARRMLEASDAIYPMFATHNAQTIATIHQRAKAMGRTKHFEFQKLHGMGDDLYAEVIPANRLDVPCRVYAPVGSHEDLLPYLVRRLLENGANSSFVNRITDEDVAIDDLIHDPVATVSAFESIPHRAFRCRSICTAASALTGPTPWASTSQTTINCARSPSRSTPPPAPTGAPRRWCRART